MALTEDERLRYARMIAVPEINTEGMERIRNGKVFVLGCGALGSLVSMYLTGSGVGEIAIADFDTVDISNLQRQLFYKESECGKKKVELLHQRMKELNSTVKINAIDVFVRNENVSDLISDYDLVIDATDHPASKYMVDEAACAIGKPYCIGGVSGFSGQVMSYVSGSTRYKDIFPQEGTDTGIMPCSINGVIGPAAGVVASVQAAEAIKFLTGTGDLLADRLFVINLLDGISRVFSI